MRIDKDDLPDLQKKELDNAIDEHMDENVDYTDWNEVKESLFAKFNIK